MGLLEDQLQQQKKKIELTKLQNKELAKHLADMDKTYDPKRIADDMKRYEEENHEWYESMKYVDKPIEYIIRDAKKEDIRTGLVIKDLLTPINNEALIKIINPIKSNNINLTEFKLTENGYGLLIDYNTTESIEFKKGDIIVYNYIKNSVKYNHRRLNYNSETYILININDILGINA